MEVRDCERQNTNEGTFLPSDGSVPNSGSGRLDENQARFRLQPILSAGMMAPTWPRAGSSAGTRLSPDSPLGTHVWSVQTNEFPAQYLKQWLLWKGFAFCQRMVCFSSMRRIRLNSIIKRVPPSHSRDICCSGQSTLCGNCNAVVDREQETHVRTGAEGGHLVARSALICHRITGASEETD